MDAKRNKNGRRLDSKGRVLKDGEQQRKSGSQKGLYVYFWTSDVTGERKCISSWKLEKNDPLPKGKRPCKSLREMIKEIQYDEFDEIRPSGDGMSVLKLVEGYVATKRNVRKTTKAGYKTVMNFLKKDKFGKKRIDNISIMEAKHWLIKLQDVDGKGISSIKTIRGVLRPAFAMAVESRLIRYNPFDFELKDLLIDDSVKREAIDTKTENRFLKFLKEDDHYKVYYDVIYILFNTGLRISEFCGLTFDDVDMEERTIDVNHQLLYGEGGMYIQPTPKTDAGNRVLPMSKGVYEAFQRIIENRPKPKVEKLVDGVGCFIYLSEEGKPTVEYYWDKKFKYALEKHNNTYKNELPKITPHVCRHTYCTKTAVSGVSVYTLKYLMGHQDISTTIRVYTHLGLMDAKQDLERVEAIKEITKYKELEEKVRAKHDNIIDIKSYA